MSAGTELITPRLDGMAHNADNRAMKKRTLRFPKGITPTEQKVYLSVINTMARVCSNATPEQLAELAAEPKVADAPRWFKEGLRSAGISLPHHANRMVQNV